MKTVTELAEDLGYTRQRINQIITDHNVKVERHGSGERPIILLDNKAEAIIRAILPGKKTLTAKSK